MIFVFESAVHILVLSVLTLLSIFAIDRMVGFHWRERRLRFEAETRVAQLETLLDVEQTECMEQAKLVTMFAERWERERVMANRLAGCLMYTDDTYEVNQIVVPVLEDFNKLKEMY